MKTLILAMALAGSTPAVGNAPVSELDLARYTGKWHEIAHLPMYFQRNCINDVTATYTKQPDGTIKVDNACRNKEGTMDRSIGAAKTVPGQPGALKVRFAPSWLSWVPMVWADYWVIVKDPDYQWAVVGGPSQKYLWILSRSPTMRREQFERLKADAKQRGYPVEKLVMAAPLD